MVNVALRCATTLLKPYIKKVITPSDDKYANINTARIPNGPTEVGTVTFNNKISKQRLAMVITATILFNILMATIPFIHLCLNKPERQVICPGLKLTLLYKINEPLTMNHLPLQAVCADRSRKGAYCQYACRSTVYPTFSLPRHREKVGYTGTELQALPFGRASVTPAR